MRVFASLTFILFCFPLFSQNKPEASELYNRYEFQEVINSLSEKENKTAYDFYLMAKSFLKLGQINQTEEYYTKAIALDSTNPRFLNSLAEFQISQKNYTNAYQSYRKLISMQDSNAYYYKKLGQVMTNMNYFEIITEEVKMVNGGKVPDNEEEQAAAREKLRENGFFQSPEQAYEKALELNPEDIESRIILIELYLDKNIIGAADNMVSAALKKYPTNKSFTMQAIKVSYKLRDYEDVVSKCRYFYSIADSNLVVQKLHGIASYYLKNPEEAVALLEPLTEIDKTSEILYYYVGLAYQEMSKNEKAILFLEKAIELGISKNIDSYYTSLAMNYEETGKHEKAIQAYKVAYNKSNDKLLLYRLARNYDEYYDDKSVALKYYELYIQQNDSSNKEYYNYALNRLEELKVQRHFNTDTVN